MKTAVFYDLEGRAKRKQEKSQEGQSLAKPRKPLRTRMCLVFLLQLEQLISFIKEAVRPWNHKGKLIKSCLVPRPEVTWLETRLGLHHVSQNARSAHSQAAGLQLPSLVWFGSLIYSLCSLRLGRRSSTQFCFLQFRKPCAWFLVAVFYFVVSCSGQGPPLPWTLHHV